MSTLQDSITTLMELISGKHLTGITPAERQSASAEIHRAVGKYVQRKLGHMHIGAYLQNRATDEEKIAEIRVIAKAIVGKDLASLEGKEEPAEDKPVPPKEETMETNKEKVAHQVEPVKQESPAVPAAQPVALPHNLEALQKFAELVGQLAPRPQAQSAPIDADAVKKLVDDILKPLQEKLAKLEAVKPEPVAEIKVVGPGFEERISGLSHWQLPQVVRWVQADVPVWLWGQAGGGKTNIGYQVAQALKLKPTVVSIDPTMTVGKMVGFKSQTTGEFIQGFAYLPFKEGGLLFLDEIDCGDPGIIAALNAMIANDKYLFPNGETVERHENFRVIAGANTKGCGAVAGYTARNRLDAATLDRFAVIELTYDLALTESIVTNLVVKSPVVWEACKETLRFPIVKRYFEKWKCVYQTTKEGAYGSTVLISPRAAILGARAIRYGIKISEVADCLIFKLVSEDTKRNIELKCGRFE